MEDIKKSPRKTPEAGARVDYPVSDLLLPHSLLHQRLLRPKQLHRQLAVRRREDVLELVPHAKWFRLADNRSPLKKWWVLLFFTLADNGAGLPSRITILQILFHFSRLYPLTDGVSVRMKQVEISDTQAYAFTNSKPDIQSGMFGIWKSSETSYNQMAIMIA